MGVEEIVISRPSPAELEARFIQVLADARFAEIGHWELNDNGEIVVSPVSGEHGRAQAVLCAELERQLGGRAWIEQAIRRPDGAPLVPDVLWGDAAFFDANKRHGLLPTPPRLCIEVVSASNAITRLREKCSAYLRSGADEAWIVDAAANRAEIYSAAGQQEKTAFAFDFAGLWQRL
mgnify:CR=1 FL=1